MTFEQGQECANELGIPFKEVSALTGANVSEMFMELTASYLGLSWPTSTTLSIQDSSPVASATTTSDDNTPIINEAPGASVPSPDSSPTPSVVTIENNFAEFRPERFLQELLDVPISSIQEVLERMLFENQQLREKVKLLEQEKQRLASIAPIPKDKDSLCAELQNAIAAKEGLQKLLDRLEAKPSILQSYSIQELDSLEEELREALKRVETRRVILQERQHTLCVICLTQPKSIVLLACSHLCLCENCLNSGSLQQCPVCRKDINGTMKVFT